MQTRFIATGILMTIFILLAIILGVTENTTKQSVCGIFMVVILIVVGMLTGMPG